eukprot:jgi/Mesen1/7892/ME000420S07034
MEKVHQRYQQLLMRAATHLDEWATLQERLLSLVSSATTVIARLPVQPQSYVLANKKAYGVLVEPEVRQVGDPAPPAGDSATWRPAEGGGMPEALIAKQVEALERLLQSAHSTLGEMGEAARSMRRRAQEGDAFLRGLRPRPSAQQAAQRWGLQPSISDCLHALRTLAAALEHECLLKARLVGALRYDSRGEDMGAIQTVLADQPHLSDPAVLAVTNSVLLWEKGDR